jgi:hypothetical protein
LATPTVLSKPIYWYSVPTLYKYTVLTAERAKY